MQDAVSEIKAKLSIEDIVAPYVQLKRSGKYLKACCPFHNEKTPSFYVSPERQIAYCFACQKGGDMFQFIQEIEGVDFKGALEILADKAHVELEEFKGPAGPSKDEKDRLKDANAEAAKFFANELWGKEEAAQKVLAYLRARAITDETIKTFQVGFAPDSSDALYRHLLQKGQEKADILASTVAISRDSGGEEVVDRFRLRLMFPIDNPQGDTIGFGGRALKKGDQPKYLNSPEYALYHKGSTLYNFSRAKQHIKTEDFALFVEGYFDVMASWQAGIKNVVATSGTALTEDQFRIMRRMTQKIALAFDGDGAGQEALLRATRVAQRMGFTIFVVKAPTGKDAADTVKENPELWVRAVAEKEPYLDYFWRKYLEIFDLTTPAGKRDFCDSFLSLLKDVEHPVERDHYLKKLSVQIGTPVPMLYEYAEKLKAKELHHAVKAKKSEKIDGPGAAQGAAQGEPQTRIERLTLYFLGMLLAFPGKFFPIFLLLKDFSVFEKCAIDLELVRPMNRLSREKYEDFYNRFAEALSAPQTEAQTGSTASSVYKQIEDTYNRVGALDDTFYEERTDGELLSRLAFEAEVNCKDPTEIEEEFRKLVALIYFESVTK
ncbi:MAG: DNA primase [Candidatus Gracilibacteria bacterium]|jgi:DNA primase